MIGKKLNGNDYAWDILRRNDMDVRALLKAAHDQEVVWLEFKADPFCRKNCPNGLTDYARWHTLKAIVAMVNTRGGCIVFGIDNDTHELADLYDNKGKLVTYNRDEFHRNIIEGILKKCKLVVKEKKTVNERGGKKEIEITTKYELRYSIERYCELKSGVSYDGKPLSVLLVTPSIGDNFSWVKVNDRETKLLVRQPGDNGRDRFLDTDEARAWTRPKLDFDDVAREKYFDNMFSPVPEFVGRRDVLKRIEQCFILPDKWVVPLLYGPAGIGKSEIAYKFAADRNVDYDTLIRVNASSCASIVDVFAEIAANPDFRRVLLPEGHLDAFELQEDEDKLLLIREAIAEERLGRVLMVIDDVRNPDVVRPSVINRYLGRICGPNFNIIATTRYPLLRFLDGEMVVPIEVGPLSNSDGVLLLGRKRVLASERDSGYAEAIVRLVGGNPWAIDIVGEYLKQKRFQRESDYERCKENLQKDIVDFFPPKEHGTMLVGNATGVVDVNALLGPTVSTMQSEERDICSLIARTWKSRGPETAFRIAFERLYGRSLQDEEWRFYVETLKKKCLVGEHENEAGTNELFLSDSISAGYFKSEFEAKSDRFTDAFLEYIRATNRLTLADAQCAKGYLDLVVKSNSSKERKAEVVFDTERCGWPFYFMGVDVRRATSSEKNFGPDEISTILELSEGVPAFEADVLEIKHMDDEGDIAEGIHKILRLRERIYADDPIMLGRSFLHAEYMGHGGILDLFERFDLLEKAEASFSHVLESDIGSRYLADTLWAKAAVRQEYFDYECVSDEERDECRDEISNLLARAKEVWPDIFAEVEDIDAYIEDGVCP